MDVTKIMEHMHAQAKKIRADLGYSGADKFAPVANVIGPQGESAYMGLGFHSDDEKRKLMNALALSARQVGAQAIVMVQDVRWTDSEKFCNYFKIAAPPSVSFEHFQRDYLLVMQRFGGEMKNLPRELWNEAICVFAKGPLMEEQGRMAFYREGPNDTVEWFEREDLDLDLGAVQINMLPDWWETSGDAQPN
jgi:hypothetical protein